MSLLKDYLPSVACQDYVKCFRIVHFESNTEIPIKIYPPKPEVVLHFFLKDKWIIELDGKKAIQPQVTLVGQQTFISKQISSSSFLNFQIVFLPSAIYLLKGIPGYIYTNKFIEAEYVFSKSINFVLEKMQHAKNYDELLLIGESFVTDLIRKVNNKYPRLDSIANLMLKTNMTVARAASESCLSSKQFNRKFYERVGINPKLYQQIIRFKNAFNLKNRYPEKDWFTIATECGYFDQQHLIKAYKEFTGFTPRDYHLWESKSPESFLGLSKSLYFNRMNFGF